MVYIYIILSVASMNVGFPFPFLFLLHYVMSIERKLSYLLYMISYMMLVNHLR